jgi:hypothetical protein
VLELIRYPVVLAGKCRSRHVVGETGRIGHSRREAGPAQFAVCPSLEGDIHAVHDITAARFQGSLQQACG